MNTLKRIIVALPTLTLILSLGCWTSATAQSFPETVPLPDGFQPEGITVGISHTAYVGSLAGGAIYAIDLRTGTGSELVPGFPGSLFAVGLDFDPRSGYLFVVLPVTDVCTTQIQAKWSISSSWAHRWHRGSTMSL